MKYEYERMQVTAETFKECDFSTMKPVIVSHNKSKI